MLSSGGLKNWTMDTTHLARIMALSAVVLLAGMVLHAQQPTDPPVAYVVSGLTASDRDSITRQVDQAGAVRLTYACVPAGILVFEPVSGPARTDVKHHVEGILASRFGRTALAETTLDRQQLESQCAALRTQ